MRSTRMSMATLSGLGRKEVGGGRKKGKEGGDRKEGQTKGRKEVREGGRRRKREKRGRHAEEEERWVNGKGGFFQHWASI